MSISRKEDAMKKAVWLVVGGLMVLSLVLASCAPATPTTPATPVTSTPPTAPTAPVTPVTPPPETPEYGGLFIAPVDGTRIRDFDDITSRRIHSANTLNLTNEDLTQGDWAKGPAGSNEAGWNMSAFPAAQVLTGAITESWEMPTADTLILHIRKGVYFHNKPPVNGRQLEAEDVAFSEKRAWQSSQWTYAVVRPWKDTFESITATDKWTVVVKTKPNMLPWVYDQLMGEIKIVPREVVEKYGDMADWRNACGTGPFILVDYVAGSAVTFRRHPNYWMKDPIGSGKGNQLPYLDSVTWLVIPDGSTRLAALRTGRIDWLGGKYEPLIWDDAKMLIQTRPMLKYLEFIPARSDALCFNNSRVPFNNKAVRQALLMGVNKQELLNTYYGGKATLLAYPIPAAPDFADMYIPLAELPKSTQELYEYHPDKAKQLLAEAGYPNGFKTHAICLSENADLMSAIRAYWVKIGVDMEIQVKESAVFTNLSQKGDFDMTIYPVTTARPWTLTRLTRQESAWYTLVDDPRIEETYTFNKDHRFDEIAVRQRTKEIVPYILENAFSLWLPEAYRYTFWWPWVKNYHGEYEVGYFSYRDFTKYLWYDQPLKKEMGY